MGIKEKIEKIVDSKDYPLEIKGSIRNELPDFFKEMGYKIGVEVGVYQGAFIYEFAVAGLEIHGVDPWIPYEGFDHMTKERIERQEVIYQRVKKRFKGYPNVMLIRKFSMDAVKDYKDESLDFVYIDANHNFRNVAADIFEWSKKVKKGGVVSGHDYTETKRMPKKRALDYHVKHVVDAYMISFNIKNFYVLGNRTEEEGEKRDMFRSWFYIKE